MRIYIVIFAVLIASLFIGCNEEMETIQPDKDFSVENGMLSFKSSETFYKTIDLLDGMSKEEMETWLVDQGFHNSLYFKFKEMEDCEEYPSDGSPLTPMDVRDRSFAALLNSEGLLSVGDTISFVQKNVENVITNGDLSMIQRIKENPEKEFENVIKNNPRPNLKSSFGIGYCALKYSDNINYIEIEVWLEIWFWTHSSYVEVDLLPIPDQSWDLNRQKMSYSILSASGLYASADNGTTPVYKSYSIYNVEYNEYENQKQIYRKTGQSGWLCAKSINVRAFVIKEGDSEGVVFEDSFPKAWCAYSSL